MISGLVTAKFLYTFAFLSGLVAPHGGMAGALEHRASASLRPAVQDHARGPVDDRNVPHPVIITPQP